MTSRKLKRIVAGLCLAAPLAGCQNWAAFKPPMLTTAPAALVPPVSIEEPKPSQKQLPPREAAEVSFTLAESLAANGHDKDAIVHYQRCRQFDPQRTGLAARLAVLHGRVGEVKEALAELDKALQENPNDPGLYNNRGYCLYSTGQWAEAEKAYRQALTLNDKHAHAWVNLGMALGMQGRYAEAFDAFTKAVKPAEAHANLGFVYYSQGKQELAMEEYRQALKMDPSLQKAQMILNVMEGKPGTTKLVSAPATKPGDLPVMVPPLPGQATR